MFPCLLRGCRQPLSGGQAESLEMLDKAAAVCCPSGAVGVGEHACSKNTGELGLTVRTSRMWFADGALIIPIPVGVYPLKKGCMF